MRPKQKARLRIRSGIYYLIHGELRVSTGFRAPEEEGEAKKVLAAYMDGVERGHIPAAPTIGQLLEAYCKARTANRKRQAAKLAFNRARNAEQSPEVAKARADEAEAAIKDAGTEQYIARHLTQHIGSVLTTNIKAATIRNYIAGRQDEPNHNRHQPVQDSTLKRELHVLRAALFWAWGESNEEWFPGLTSCPTFEIPVSEGRPRSRYLTREQAQMLLDACDTPHVKLFIKLALGTAARKSAIENLRWENVDFERGIIDFGVVDHKKRRPIAKITDDFLPELRAAYEARTTDYVLEWRKQRAGDVKKSIERLGQKCGFPWLTAHVLKHTKISWMVAEGIGYDRIADVTQTSVRMIRDQYSHIAPI